MTRMNQADFVRLWAPVCVPAREAAIALAQYPKRRSAEIKHRARVQKECRARVRSDACPTSWFGAIAAMPPRQSQLG